MDTAPIVRTKAPVVLLNLVGDAGTAIFGH